MYRFWDSFIEPVFEMVEPKVVVEIGSDRGPNTRNLAEYCLRHNAELHVIDPMPKYDVAEWERRYDGHAVFHLDLSLPALREIEGFDVVLIDGDHNWYTVFNELKLIEARCKAAARPFPLVFMHDVGWPYGRRDSYYDPDGIPEKERQPYERKGMLVGSSELAEEGGFNRGFPNATQEGTPRNGVLTAVEDFLAQTGYEVDLVTLPGLHGFGMLVPRYLKEGNAKLAEFLSLLELPPPIARHIESVEEDRLRVWTEKQELNARLRQLQVRHKKQIQNLRPQGPGRQESPPADEGLRERMKTLRQRNKKLVEKVERLEERLRALGDG